jgi:hypothetical protein
MLISIRRSIIRLSTGWRSTLLIRNKAQTIRLRTSNGKLFKRRKAISEGVIILFFSNCILFLVYFFWPVLTFFQNTRENIDRCTVTRIQSISDNISLL